LGDLVQYYTVLKYRQICIHSLGTQHETKKKKKISINNNNNNTSFCFVFCFLINMKRNWRNV